MRKIAVSLIVLVIAGSTLADPPASRPADETQIHLSTTQPQIEAGKPAPASQPAATTQAADNVVSELVKLLGNRDYGVREAATKKLVEMGRAIQPFLKVKLLEKDLDPEVAIRIQTVLGQINPLKRSVTDAGTGITVSIQSDGSIAGRKGGMLLWQLSHGGVVQSTSLKIENGQVIGMPGNLVINAATGQIISVGKP